MGGFPYPPLLAEKKPALRNSIFQSDFSITMIITVLLDIMVCMRFGETLLAEMLSLYEDPWLYKTVKEIAVGYKATLQRVDNKVILERVRETLERTAREVAELSNGHMRSKSEIEATEILIKIIRTGKKKEAQAVAHFELFFSWWSRDIAKQYLRENQNFIRRGGKITRILIVPKAKLLEAKDFVQMQKEYDIAIRIAIAEGQPELLSNEAFLIVDNEIVSRTLYSIRGTINGSYVTTDRFEVDEIRNKFDLLLLSAKAPEDFPELSDSNPTDADAG